MANGSRKAHHTNDQGPDMSVWKRILTGVVVISIVALTVAVAISLALQDLPIGIQAPSPVAQSTPFTPIPSAANTPTPSLVATASSTPLAIEPTPTLLPETPTTEPALPVATPLPPPSPPTVPVCRPPAGWVPYTVRPGDTLVSLAYRYRTSVSQLMYASCLTSQVLYVGQVVHVPSVVVTPTPRPPCGPPPNWVRYAVQPGDTLYSLSVRTRTTVYAIVQANCLTGFTIYVGQQLWLPSLPPPATFTPPAPPTASPTLVLTPTPGGDTPTPTAILSPTPGDTVTPTQVPGDTPTPTEAPGQTPTSTLTPTAVPADTPTPPATATPTPLPPAPTPTNPPPPTPTLPPPTPTPPPPTNTPVPFPTPSGG